MQIIAARKTIQLVVAGLIVIMLIVVAGGASNKTNNIFQRTSGPARRLAWAAICG